MRILQCFIWFSFLLIGLNGHAANRFWVASAASNWNNTANWSNVPGGAGGQTVPGGTDVVYFNILGAGNCTVDAAVNINGINLIGYSGTLDIVNFPFNPSAGGNVASTFGSGTITANVGYILSFTSNSPVSFSGGIMDVELDFTASAVHLNGSAFNLPIKINSLGTIASMGVGGNTFSSTFELEAFGTNFFNMGLTNPDTFNGVATFLNRGASKIRIGQTSIGNQFNANLFVGSDAGMGVGFGENNGTTIIANGQTISVAPLGFITGQLLLQNITQIGSTPQNLTLTGGGYLYSQNSTWGGNITFQSPSIRTDNSDYLGTSFLEKTGPGGDASSGNNTFTGNCTISNNNNGNFTMGNVFGDAWVSDLTISNTGTSYIYLAANSAFNTVGGDINVNVATIGTPGNSGVYVCAGSNSTLTVSGDANLNATASATTANLHFCYNGSLTVNGDLNILNTSTSNNMSINVGFFPTSTVTIGGTTSIDHQGAGTNNRVILGVYGDCTFNGSTTVNCASTATNGEVRFHYGVTCNNTYNGNIFVNNTGATSDGVRFGEANGSGTMTAGYKFSIGGIGYLSSWLLLKNFHQVGLATPQNISFPSPNTYFWMENSSWEGPITYQGNSIFVNNCSFDGTTFIEKQFGLLNTNCGGNTFNAPVTICNSSSFPFTLDDVIPNDYNSDVTIKNTGPSVIQPSNQCSSTYGGDIYIETNYPVVMASTGSAKIVMDGTGPQSINTIGTTPKPNFIHLQTLNFTSDITLNTPIILVKKLELTQGNLITTNGNVISMNVGSVVLAVSDNAFVDGPVNKTGNTGFTFPVGNNGVYQPIEISASAGIQIFSAQFFGNDVIADGLPDVPFASTLDHISNCEYWILNRQFGSSAVTVRLHYKPWGVVNCSGVLFPTALRVSKWDGTTWLDLGNGGSAGTASQGWVQTGTAINSFSPFTIATTLPGNPLPIELIDFTATVEGPNVRLNWSTASEVNNDYFEIERSSDGNTFTPILSQAGAGNSTSSIDYTDLDRNPFYGLSYYRLKQVDFDGKVSYSKAVSITFDKPQGDELFVYPNPAKNEIVLNGDFEISANIRVVDILGKDLTALTKLIQASEKSKTLDISKLPAGIYLLQTADQTVRFTKL